MYCKSRLFQIILTGLVLISLIAGCTANAPGEQERSLKYAEITFVVNIPGSNSSINYSIEIVDEVTGLALNPSRYSLSMSPDGSFRITLPFLMGSILKYRYLQDGSPVKIEHTLRGDPVRYRVFLVDGVATVQDSVAGWAAEMPDDISSGKISGVVTDSSGAPLPDVLISVAGEQMISAPDGRFAFSAISPGTHLLAAISTNGSVQSYQQGVTIHENATTPVSLVLSKSRFVDITFTVKPPENTGGLPVRLVGNITSLGNTFSDLYVGSSTVASRAPLLTYNLDGSYSITLNLPVGYDLRYRYTLGDGFWNSETSDAKTPHVRQMIVPDRNTAVNDQVISWAQTSNPPVDFTVTVPSETPVTDQISIQFNAFGWSSPIPMWPLGNNQWYFRLYNPFENIAYRYCRNDQCGVADDADTAGNSSDGRYLNGQTTIIDIIHTWQWLTNDAIPITADAVNPRSSDFVAAVEFQAGYHPSWLAYYPYALRNIEDLGANTIVFPVTWSYSDLEAPSISCDPAQCPLSADLQSILQQASSLGLRTVIYPRTYPLDQESFWNNRSLSDEWWNAWFDQYAHVLLSEARFASQNNVPMIIIGETYLTPAITGILPDGSLANLPGDSDARWNQIISEIREVYAGSVYWALDYSGQVAPVPSWVDQLDGLYVLWHPSLAVDVSYSVDNILVQMIQLMDEDIYPLSEMYQKPIIINAGYSSSAGTMNCVKLNDICISDNFLDQPLADGYRVIPLDLQGQVDAYNVLLTVINQRDWIDGFSAAGYYPPVMIIDGSSSVHGKPAADVLWYWYPGFTNKHQ